jgi:AsmA protein
MRKKLIIATAGTLAALLVVAGVVLSLLIDIDRFRPQLARAMSAAIGRSVTVGHISLSLLSASAVVQDLSIADDPEFGSTPFLTARKVRIGIVLRPLITGRHLQIDSLRIEQPRVTLRRSRGGTWNFASLGVPSAPADAPSTSSPLTLSIDRLAISEGTVAVATAGVDAAHGVYEGLDLEVRDFSTDTRFGFAARVTVPGGGSLKVNGKAGPMAAEGIGSMPFEATLDGAGVDIKRAGLLDPAAGLGGVLGFHLAAASDGARIRTSGTVRGEGVQLVPGASPASQPVDLSYAADYKVATHDGSVSRGELRVAGAAVRVVGSFSTRGSAPVLRLTLTGHHMPVVDLQALLPAVGAALPRGARFTRGALDLDLTARGALDRVVIAGPVQMTDAALSGFDAGSQITKVASLAGAQPAGETVIQTLAVTLNIAPDGINADGLTCVMPSIGRVDGGGTIAPDGALAFRMVARLARTSGVAGHVARLVSFGAADGAVPFRIAGTTSSPVFVPDVARAVSGAARSPGAISKAGGFVRSLFRR